MTADLPRLVERTNRHAARPAQWLNSVDETQSLQSKESRGACNCFAGQENELDLSYEPNPFKNSFVVR